MAETQPAQPEPSVVDAMVRVVESAQRLLADRVDLVRFELRQFAQRAARGAMLMTIGAFLMGGAWLALMGGAVAWLQQFFSLPMSLVTVATATAGLGGAAMAVGARFAHGNAAPQRADDLERTGRVATQPARTDGGGPP